MIQEISMINGNICNFEKEFGITFSRSSAAKATDNNMVCIHLLPYERINPNVASNKRIMGFLAILDTSENKCGLGVIVYVNSLSTFTGIEIWDINSNDVLNSCSVSSGPPKYDDASAQALKLEVNPTIHSVVITVNPGGSYRVEGTLDIEINGARLDICDFDVTFTPETIEQYA